MEITITILSFFIAILQIDKLFGKNMSWKAWGIFLLTFAVFVLSLILYNKNRKKEEYSLNYGELDGNLNNKQVIRPQIAVGKTIFDIESGKSFTDLFHIKDFDLWIEDGKMFLTMKVKDTSGKLIALINKNEWLVNPNNFFDRNFDDRGIEILGESGTVIMHADYDGEKINLEGLFINENNWSIELNKNEDGLGTIGYWPPSKKISLNIEPIFKYPSGLHQGERIKKIIK